MPFPLRLACCAFTLFAACPVALSQSPPPRDPQAIAVLAQSRAVMGSAVAVAALDTVVQGNITFPGDPSAPAAAVTIKAKGTEMMRWESIAGGRATATVVNRGRSARLTERGWHTGPSANSRHKRIEHLPALLLAAELARSDVTASYAGMETIEGRSAHHLRVGRVSSLEGEVGEQLTKASELNLFVDAQTFFVLKIAYIHFSETDHRRGLPMEVHYSDYRLTGGHWIPFRQTVVFNGNTISQLQLTSFAANVGLADSEFAGR